MKRLLALALLMWATNLSVLAGDLELGLHFGDIRSGAGGDYVSYQGYLRNVGTSDLYLNGWDYYPDPFEDWSLLSVGSDIPALLSSGEERAWENIIGVSIEADAVPGMYNAEFVVRGGVDENAQDELGRLAFQLEVVDDYHFNVEIPNPDRVAEIGDTVVYSHRYVNQGARDIRFTYIWTSFYDPLAGVEHNFQHSLIWEVTAGQTVETDVFSLTILPGADLGLRRGAGGVDGGYYPGDTHEFGVEWSLTVVPEPSGLVALWGGMTSLGLLVRSRRKR